MPLPRRALLASLASLPAAALAQAGGDGADEGLVRLAGSCILGGSRAPQLHPTLAAMLARGALAGALIASENFHASPWALDATVRAVRAATPSGAPPALVAADQEGGVVSHLSPVVPRLPSITTLGGIDDEALTGRWGSAMGGALRRVGVNLDLAPVLDVRTNGRNMVVHGRTFGSRPELAARHARPLVAAMLGAGVLPCAKHFPGHGDTTEDSHHGLPRVAHDLARLDAVELVPFRAVIDVVPAVMLAHVVYAGVDPARPATLSRPLAHGLLRERLGFRGASVSDDLEMAAIRRNWGVAAGAVHAMEAGCDLLIIAHTPGYALEAARAMARRAESDRSFRTRLEEASGRVRALRERLNAAPAAAAAESPQNVLREVARRTAPGARRARPLRDPTR